LQGAQLGKDILSYAVALAFNFLVQTVCLGLLWRSLKGSETQIFPLVQVWLGLGVSTLELGLSQAILRFSRAGHVLKSILRFWALVLLPLSILLGFLFYLIFSPNNSLYLIFLSIVATSTYVFYTLCSTHLRSARLSLPFLVINLLKNGSLLISLGLFYLQNKLSLDTWLLLLTGHNLLGALLCLLTPRYYIKHKTTNSYKTNSASPLAPVSLTEIMRFALPLWLANLVFTSEAYIDLAFINSFFPQDLIPYRQAVELSMIAGALLQLIKLVLPPYLYEKLGKGEIFNLHKTVLSVSCWTLPAFWLFGISSPLLLKLYLGKEPGPATLSLSWILLFVLFLQVQLFWLRTYQEYKKSSILLLLIALTATVLNILGNWLLVPSLGGAGAGLAACAASLFSLYYLWIINRPSIWQTAFVLLIQVIAVLSGWFFYSLQETL